MPRRLAAILVAAILVPGCASIGGLPCPGDQAALVSDLLYFGASNPDREVSEAEWKDFLAVAVTPRFPEGFSSWDANGQWKSGDGDIVRENAHVLSIVHGRDESKDAAIRALVSEYKSRFRQESVLRVSSPACASF